MMPSIPLILSASGSGTGPTQLRLRNRLADELGFYHATTVSTLAAGGEASRVVLADAFRDDEAGYEFSGQAWLYVRDGAQAGEQRRIISQPEAGYIGNMGALMLSRPFAAALAAGTTVEITNPLPVKRTLALKGLNDCINEGLARIWIEVRVPITGNGTYEYDLASYPWIQRYEQTMGIYDSMWFGQSVTPALSSTPYRFVTTGAARTLVTRTLYSSADTFYLAAIVRADRYVYDGSAWGYVTTPGLQGDAWQAACPEEWSVTFGMVMALRQLTKILMTRSGMDKAERATLYADLMMKRQQWASAAASIKLREFPQPIQEPTEGLVYLQAPAVWV